MGHPSPRPPLQFDLQSGANCLDADALSVHIVFGDYIECVRPRMLLRATTMRSWPRLLHRKLYYKVAHWMERLAYTNQKSMLVLYARKTGIQLRRLYGRSDDLPVLYLGVDHSTYNLQRREQLRPEVRKHLGLVDDSFVLLLIGNDWRNKGVPYLLEAVGHLLDLPVRVLIVTDERSAHHDSLLTSRDMRERLSILPPRSDVEFYYAAADAYVGPSLEDTFGLPPQEAMACGLPVIVSAANGTSEIITDGVDGLILQDPTDAVTLAAMIRRLHDDPAFRATLGENAARTAMQYTWERNGRELAAIFLEIIQRKAAKSSEPQA